MVKFGTEILGTEYRVKIKKKHHFRMMILFLRSDVEGKSEDLFQWATEEELILFLGPSGRPSPFPPPPEDEREPASKRL